MWFCVDCIGLWTNQTPEEVMRQVASEKTWKYLDRHHTSLHLAWTVGHKKISDPGELRKSPLLELVIGSEQDAHAKLRDIRNSVAPENSDPAMEFSKVMIVRDGPDRDEQIKRREFWLRHFNALWADCIIGRLTQDPVTHPVSYEGRDTRVLRPCFSVVDAWFTCPNCGLERSAMIKATVHEAYCDKCHSWMEWRSATWATEVLDMPPPTAERKARDAWIYNIQAKGRGPHEPAIIANTLVHRKGYGSLWSYVASRAKQAPRPTRAPGGPALDYETPEVFVEQYSPREHHIFLLLVLEELGNKRREAMLAHDQDIAARGGWMPTPPPPSSSASDPAAVELGLRSEAAAARHVTVGEWAPSLCRR